MSKQRWTLIVEDNDRNVETEVVDIHNWIFLDNTLIVECKNAGSKNSTRIHYNTRNFRTLTLEPVED